MRPDRKRSLASFALALASAVSISVVGGCNNPQFEAGTVEVEPRSGEAEPPAPGPIDTSTRDSSEGGER
jgi:hypothetical protein